MRHLICLIICLLLAVSFWLTASAAFNNMVCGDADGDGTITSLDVVIIQRVLSEIVADDTGGIAKRGDVDGNGLSLHDATAIQRYLAQFNDEYHIGERVTPSSPFAFPTEDNQLPIM